MSTFSGWTFKRHDADASIPVAECAIGVTWDRPPTYGLDGTAFASFRIAGADVVYAKGDIRVLRDYDGKIKAAQVTSHDENDRVYGEQERTIKGAVESWAGKVASNLCWEHQTPVAKRLEVAHANLQSYISRLDRARRQGDETVGIGQRIALKGLIEKVERLEAKARS